MCLDRVLLMKTKVLTLDLGTEDLVQATISQVFSECTDTQSQSPTGGRQPGQAHRVTLRSLYFCGGLS